MTNSNRPHHLSQPLGPFDFYAIRIHGICSYCCEDWPCIEHAYLQSQVDAWAKTIAILSAPEKVIDGRAVRLSSIARSGHKSLEVGT